MRQRKKKMDYEPQYSTKGYTMFEIGGTVQAVQEHEKSEADFVTFCVCNKTVRKDYYQRIQVRVPHKLNVLLEPGDAVYISGEIISYWNEDSGHSEISLTATQILDSNEVPMTGATSDDTPGE